MIESYDEIPSLDLAAFSKGSTRQRQAFVQALGDAYQQIGFVAIRNHYLKEDTASNLYQAIKSFFTLPDSIKQKYEVPALSGQRGYIGKGKEHAKGRSTGDLKEFYHVGQEIDSGDPLAHEYPQNIWPDEVKDFKQASLTAFRELEETGLEMLKAIAIYLAQDELYFEEKVRKGNSILRQIHYFPIENPKEIPSDAVRAAAHGDINLITLLMGASADGLQVKRRDGKWISITALPDQLVVNVGDMLERLTNGKLKSTIHRVINPPPEMMTTSRYSIPFFMHPRSSMSLAALPNCADLDHPKQWPDITAGAFLDQRLREIGLKK